jgi:hypothetical protein
MGIVFDQQDAHVSSLLRKKGYPAEGVARRGIRPLACGLRGEGGIDVSGRFVGSWIVVLRAWLS